MAKILSGKEVRDSVAQDLKKKISRLSEKPHLAIIQIGDLSESNAYIRQKKLFGARVGAKVTHIRLPASIAESKLISKIKRLNGDKHLHGMIVQMPIPPKLNKEKVFEAIDPRKDVDGLHSQNVKRLWQGKNDGLLAATAKGILTLLKYFKVPLQGRKAVMVGCSNLVGKPTALALLNEKATVTIAHRYSTNLSRITREGDIIVVAAGVPNLITRNHVKKGQVVIDVGINIIAGSIKSGKNRKLEDEISARKIVGDVDFKAVSKIVKAISPVPGGVGPMTVASLFLNLMTAYKSLTSKS